MGIDMSKINYIDLNRLNQEDIEGYKAKTESNLRTFSKVFGVSMFTSGKYSFEKPKGRIRNLMQKISDITSIPLDDIESVNMSDEMLNDSSFTDQMFGCTSMGAETATGKIIGQTMDLFTVDLSLVREGGSLYITMPPYLSLMGMNEHLAFCTNHMFSPVQNGVPVSHIRREILNHQSLRGFLEYLKEIKVTTSVNYLITDGEKTLDIEVTPEGIRVHDQITGKFGRYIAHTNHLVDPGIDSDKSCSRLSRAVELLGKGKTIDSILDDPGITVPITPFNLSVGFGTIIKTIMDVNNKTLYYKEPSEKEYVEVSL